MSHRFWYLLLLCFLLHRTSSSVITVDDNGYKGVVVAIHRDIPEDEDVVKNIKTLFSNASSFLYASTKNGVYFKEVTIVVPSTWSTRPEYDILPGSFFSNAHVRVDIPNPEFGDAPNTLQPGSCGEQGQYIHLTPGFLKELHGKTIEMFGAPERQLVHEWAHLRYGVFDEYGIPGDKRFPMFYYENGRVRPTSCVRDIKGWIESRDGGPCSMTPDGEVDSDCIFIPNMDSTEAKASIMYMPFIPSMEGFCDDDSHKHNMRAPTKHNAMCNYRSTWDVISHHDDFQKARKKRDAVSELTETLFRLIQSPKIPNARYVLVLDISGSMNGEPMKLLHQAATRLVKDRIPDGSFLGIVQFSTDASILRNLTEVNNNTRTQLSDSLPSKDDGGRTAIGKGLKEAINVLKNDNIGPEAGLIMLITDGEENVTPMIEEVLPDILSNKVIINAVAFGSEASARLEYMTTITGGRGYFFSNMNDSRPASALDSAFLDSVTSQADIELQPVQLKDEMIDLHEPVIKRSVYVDQELGKDTIFTATSRHIERIEISLESPNGTIYGSSSSQYSRDDSVRKRIQITFPEAEPGKWVLTYHRQGDYPIVVGFSVTSEAKDIRDQPIRARSWLSEVQLTFPAYAKVYAEVKKGYRAVIGANVLATVERPMGASVDIELRDDGFGADVTEDDGIYTGYFTHFNGNGRYAVISRVSNDGQARLKQGSQASAALAMPHLKGRSHDTPMDEFLPENFLPVSVNDTDKDKNESSADPASKFDRSSNSGTFRLGAWIPDAGDVIPPGNVIDLVVLSVKSTTNDTNMVTLQWTTPGDDLDAGQVTSLELRASNSMEELRADFENGFIVGEMFFTNGTLSPEPPGHKQQLTLKVPDNLQGNGSEPWTLYLAMRAKDDTGNVSEGYNIAQANFGIRIHSRHASEETTGTSSKHEGASEDEKLVKDSGNSSFKWWPLAVGIAAAFTIIMIIVVLAVIILKKHRMRTYSSVQRE